MMNDSNIFKVKPVTLNHKLDTIYPLIGNTPIKPFLEDGNGIYAKLEYFNFSGSIKDRATFSILKNAIDSGLLDEKSTIIESTSGNFGISLALFAKTLGIKFIPVIDSNITPINRKILKFLSENVIEVTERDETGGYLLNRMKTVELYKKNNTNVFHPNQYMNKYNYLGYNSMVKEIYNQVDHLDYIIIAVSTGGTITGISTEVKKYFPEIKVIGVDVEGSLVFDNKPSMRNLSGIGSSRKSNFIDKYGNIDEVMILSEDLIVNGCREMVLKHSVFAGASSGAVYVAAKKIQERHHSRNPKIMIICPDRGVSYINNIYNL